MGHRLGLVAALESRKLQEVSQLLKVWHRTSVEPQPAAAVLFGAK